MYGYLLAYDWFALSRGGWAALIVTTAIVLAAEAFNSAVEAVVDLASPDKHPFAAKAKDIAAAAVLLCSVGAIAVGIVLLYQPEAFRALWAYYRQTPAMLAVLGLSLVGTAWFILGFRRKK